MSSPRGKPDVPTSTSAAQPTTAVQPTPVGSKSSVNNADMYGFDAGVDDNSDDDDDETEEPESEWEKDRKVYEWCYVCLNKLLTEIEFYFPTYHIRFLFVSHSLLLSMW